MAGEITTDEELALRNWLRTKFGSGTGVWIGLPKGSPTFPLVEIRGRIGGSPMAGFPIDQPRVSFHVWGGPNGATKAVKARNDLVTFLEGLSNETLDSTTYAFYATVDDVRWLPDESDEDNPLARYVVDASLALRSV